MNIEKLMNMDEKQIYKRYTIGISCLIILISILMIFIEDFRTIVMGISLGINIGLWIGYSLRRLV